MCDLATVAISLSIGTFVIGFGWGLRGSPLFRPPSPPPPPPTPAELRAEIAVRDLCDPAFFGFSDGDLEIARLNGAIAISRRGTTIRMVGWNVRHGSRWEPVHSIERLRRILVDHFSACSGAP